MFSIDRWDKEERPRERLLKNGAKTLSIAELLAIILRSGRKGASALDVAREILSIQSNDISGFLQLSKNEIQQIDGIGEAKLASVLAIIELIHRSRYAEVDKKAVVRSSQEAYQSMYPYLSGLDHEQFWVLFLNHGNRIIETKNFGKGGLTSTVVDQRIILRNALEMNSTALILSHNHPSGNLNPSRSDKELTEKIREGARLLDIKVLDHLILSSEGYFSFADEGLL